MQTQFDLKILALEQLVVIESCHWWNLKTVLDRICGKQAKAASPNLQKVQPGKQMSSFHLVLNRMVIVYYPTQKKFTAKSDVENGSLDPIVITEINYTSSVCAGIVYTQAL